MSDNNRQEYMCPYCGWYGKDYLIAPNPFDIGELHACPSCLDVEGLRLCCDEESCHEIATSGFDTETGYRRTCSKHWKGGVNVE